MGLPRMRGDRPVRCTWTSSAARATPHARGSTRVCRREEYSGQGYPACAGIDPKRPKKRSPRSWLPRMRGDRPPSPSGSPVIAVATPHARGSTSHEFAPATTLAAATPHARGSTRLRAFGAQGRSGYPACAGIDLGLVHRQRINLRLPRMRGDRPCFEPLMPRNNQATPHARGSTWRRISA